MQPTNDTLVNTKEKVQASPDGRKLIIRSHDGLPIEMEKYNSEEIAVRQLKISSQRNLYRNRDSEPL